MHTVYCAVRWDINQNKGRKNAGKVFTYHQI